MALRFVVVFLGICTAVFLAVGPIFGDDPSLPEVADREEWRAGGLALPHADPARLAAIAERLESRAPFAPPAPSAPAPSEVDAPSQVEGVPPADPAFKYLGPIYDASRVVAVISVNGRQRIVSEGTVLGEFKVVEVKSHQVALDGPRGIISIPISQHGGHFVTWLAQPPDPWPDRAVRAAAFRAAMRAGDEEGMARAMGKEHP
jgi:hypothetical protein